MENSSFKMTLLCATLALSACAWGVATERGSVKFQCLVLGTDGARSVQFLFADINAMKVTVKDAADDSGVATQIFSGTGLASHMNAGTKTFSFTVENLKVRDGARPAGYSYKALVEAFLEANASSLIGTSTSDPFTVVSGSVTTVTFPTITLGSTPIGSASTGVTIIDNPPPPVMIN